MILEYFNALEYLNADCFKRNSKYLQRNTFSNKFKLNFFSTFGNFRRIFVTNLFIYFSTYYDIYVIYANFKSYINQIEFIYDFPEKLLYHQYLFLLLTFLYFIQNFILKQPYLTATMTENISCKSHLSIHDNTSYIKKII